MDGPRMTSCTACGAYGVGPGEAPYDEIVRCINCDDPFCVARCLTNGACEDPECQEIAAEMAKLEAEIAQDEENWRRAFGLMSPLDAFSVEGK